MVLAGRAKEALALDRIIFIPAADPPHKKKPSASYSHRVAMLEAALAGAGQDSNFEISLLEAERSTPSYTVDTLIELRKRLGDQRFYFIIGADSLMELHLWYHYRELPSLSDFIVVSRPGIGIKEVNRAIEKLPGPFVSDKSQRLWRRDDGAEIYLLADVSKNISSSLIRKQLRQGQRPDTVDRLVLDYIMEQRLYQGDVTANESDK